MSTQIAVRLPDELVGYLDALVAEGAGSRAAVVAAAVEAHRRRRLAERDADLLATTGDYDDLAGIVAHASLDLD
jgi:Arc/MetJ-type ribon-helix-helix transcriptional regulator